MVRLQSFVLGMAMAGTMLGFLLLIVTFVSGDDAPSTPSQTLLAATPTSRTGTSTQLSPTAGTPTPVGASTPGNGTPTPDAAGTPGPTTTAIAAAAALPDRTSCAAIRGTDYRSDAERSWYIANCPSEPVAVSTAGTSSGPSISQSSAPVVPTLPPRNPFLVSFEALVTSIVTETNQIAAYAGAPNFVERDWRQSTIASAKQVEQLSGVVSTLSPPDCLVTAHANLRAVTFELGVASGLLISAVEQNNSNLLRLAEQRLTASRAGLPQVAARVAAAECPT